MVLTPRPGIMKMAPYVPGASKLKGFDTIIKLSSNEGALGPSPKATAAFKATANELHRYPDGNALELRRSIGDRHGLNPEKVICGAGSDEILALLARAYAGPGDEILFGEHAFVMYPIFALSVGATPIKAPETKFTVSVDALLSKVTERTRIVYVANPNNPTGTMLTSNEMSRLRAGLREDILLVIDAAYAEYVIRDDYSPGIELVDASENVVMTRTFSKIYAMGGARLGWAYCPETVCEVINKIRPPFNVTSGAQAAGIAAVNDVEFMIRSRDHNAEWLPWLSNQLEGMGLNTVPSVGNFLLVLFPRSGPHTSNDAMDFITSRGIVPRRTSSAGIPEGIRITVGIEDEIRAITGAISDFMKKV